MTAVTFTIVTSTRPAHLSKEFRLSPTGELIKSAAADMVEGTADATQSNFADLLRVLDALKSNQAVVWGLPIGRNPGDRVTIATRDDVAAGKAPHGAIPRDRAHWEFREGAPGVMMLDHDGGKDGEQLTRDEVLDRVLEAVPELANAPMHWRPSSSAGIVHPDGRQLTGLHKHRFYVLVTNAADIPEIGKRLIARLWATEKGNGRHAWAQVGNAGQVMLRTLFDAQVWQPERLDFAGPPILRDGLTRRFSE